MCRYPAMGLVQGRAGSGFPAGTPAVNPAEASAAGLPAGLAGPDAALRIVDIRKPATRVTSDLAEKGNVDLAGILADFAKQHGLSWSRRTVTTRWAGRGGPALRSIMPSLPPIRRSVMEQKP